MTRGQIARFAVSIVAVAILLSQLPVEHRRAFFANVQWPWLPVLMAVYVGDRVFMAWKWLLLARVHRPDLTLMPAVRLYFVGTFFGTALPLGGLGPDITRVALLTRSGVPLEDSVSSVLVERVVGLAATLAMVVISLAPLLLLVPQRGDVPWREVLWGLGALGAVCVLVAAWFPGSGSWLVDLLQRAGLGRQLGALRRYGRRRGLLLVSFGLAWLEQGAPVLAFFVAGRLFDVDIGILEALAIVPFATLLMRLPVSFAGLGVREIGVVSIASLVGIAPGDALLVSLSQFVIHLLSVTPGLWFWLRGSALTDRPETGS